MQPLSRAEPHGRVRELPRDGEPRAWRRVDVGVGEGQACSERHSGKHVLDLADDHVLVVAESDGVGDVRTAEGRVPVPFDHLVYDLATESWESPARGQNVTQFPVRGAAERRADGEAGTAQNALI